MKNTLEAINSRLDDREKCIFNLEDKIVEITQTISVNTLSIIFNVNKLNVPKDRPAEWTKKNETYL